MAVYATYKKVRADQIPSGEITSDDIALGANVEMGVQWIYNERGLRCHRCSSNGNCCEQANGKCCLWTVSKCYCHLRSVTVAVAEQDIQQLLSV